MALTEYMSWEEVVAHFGFEGMASVYFWDWSWEAKQRGEIRNFNDVLQYHWFQHLWDAKKKRPKLSRSRRHYAVYKQPSIYYGEVFKSLEACDECMAHVRALREKMGQGE